MKRVILLIPIIMIAKLISAQGNLVPNPSFELNTACPTSFGQVYKIVSWSNPTGGSPEYYDSCGTGGVGVPANWFGSQIPFDGSAYVGIAGGFGNYYEYVQTHLTDSLHAGAVYCVSFNISLADNAALTTMYPQTYFSVDSINSSTAQCLNYIPQVMDTNKLYDSIGWIQVNGTFMADGGEMFLTLGSFVDSANTQFDTVNTNPNAEEIWYFYVDMVQLFEQVNAEAGADTTICLGDSLQLGGNAKAGIQYIWNTSYCLSDSTSSAPWVHPTQTTVYYLTIADTGSLYCTGSIVDSVTIVIEDCRIFHVPSLLQVGEILRIDPLPDYSSIELYDARGRVVYRSDNYQNDFNTISLRSGMYFYYFEFQDGRKQGGKICVIR